MIEKAIELGGGATIHIGRPIQKGDISNLISKSEIEADNMDCQAGSRLDYLAYHLMNGFHYGRRGIRQYVLSRSLTIETK